MTNLLKRFKNDESGATAIEYGLIAALIGTMIIAGVTLIGENLDGTFTAIGNAVESNAPGS